MAASSSLNGHIVRQAAGGTTPRRRTAACRRDGGRGRADPHPGLRRPILCAAPTWTPRADAVYSRHYPLEAKRVKTTRQRFLQTLNFEQPDPPFVRAIGGWQETMDRWRTQGWDGRPLHEVFGTDAMLYMGIPYGPCPTFEYELSLIHI